MADENPRGQRPWQHWLLVASLAVNLCVLTFGVVLALKPDRRHHGDGFIERLVSVLPEERRQVADEAQAEGQDEMAALRLQSYEAHMRTISVIREPVLDETTLRAALAEREAILAQRSAIRSRRFVVLMSKLEPGERVLVADRLESVIQRRVRRVTRP